MLAPLRAPLLGSEWSAALTFDVPGIYTLELRRVAGEMLEGLDVPWMDPTKSCSTTTADDRLTVTARYAKGARTEAQRLAVCSQIWRELDCKRAFVSEEDIYSDMAAPLLEATDTAALLALWPLFR